jgi:hypothetical protein
VRVTPSIASPSNGEHVGGVEAAATAEPATAASVETTPTVPAEASWTPPPLAEPAPSPVPTFARPAKELPLPLERPTLTVPAARPRARSGHPLVIVGVALLAVAGGVAIWFGLGGPRPPGRPGAVTASKPPAAPAPTPAAPAPAPASTASTPAAPAAPPLAPAPVAAAPVAAPTARAAVPAAPTGAAARRTTTTEAEGAAPKAAPPREPAPTTKRAPAPAESTEKAANEAAATPPKEAAAEGAFEVVTTPEGATVFVDGEPQGTTPAQLSLSPGSHKLIVAGEGQKLVKREVQVAPGGRVEIALEPAKLPGDIAGPAGLKVRCRTKGELRVYVDGADSGRSCPNDERINVSPGNHRIGLYSPRTGAMHEVEHEVVEGDHSTRVYVKY